MPQGGFVAWAKRPENQIKLAGAVAGVAVVGAIVVFAGRADRGLTAGGSRGVPKYKDAVTGSGFVVCPKDVGKIAPSTKGLAQGDFVVISLAAKDQTFVESTWARVRSFSPTKDKLYVEISGELTQAGIKPLATERHGFRIGERLAIDKDCVFDVLRKPSTFKGQILCGPNLAVIVGPNQQPLYTLVDTSNVAASDRVRIVVASPEAKGTAWYEPLWIHVTSISPGQQVIRGLVIEQPQRTGDHGLSMYSAVEFGRDCVIGVSTGGS